HDGLGDAGRRGRDQHPLGAGSEVRPAGLVRLEEARAFKHEVDAELLVRQLAGIALLGHRDVAAVDLDAVLVGGHRPGEAAMGAVVGEQQRVRLRIGEVVDRDQLEIVVGAFEQRAGDEPPDASESVDRNLHRHGRNSCYLPSLSRILGTMASAEKPKCLNNTSAEAEAPNRSRPMVSPSLPTKRSHPRVTPASTETLSTSSGSSSARKAASCFSNSSTHGIETTSAPMPFVSSSFAQSSATATSDPVATSTTWRAASAALIRYAPFAQRLVPPASLRRGGQFCRRRASAEGVPGVARASAQHPALSLASAGR